MRPNRNTLGKTSKARPAKGYLGHGASTPEAAPEIDRVGDHGMFGPGVIFYRALALEIIPGAQLISHHNTFVGIFDPFLVEVE